MSREGPPIPDVEKAAIAFETNFPDLRLSAAALIGQLIELPTRVGVHHFRDLTAYESSWKPRVDTEVFANRVAIHDPISGISLGANSLRIGLDHPLIFQSQDPKYLIPYIHFVRYPLTHVPLGFKFADGNRIEGATFFIVTSQQYQTLRGLVSSTLRGE